MIGTTQFVNALVQGTQLSKVFVIRLCGTSTMALPQSCCSRLLVATYLLMVRPECPLAEVPATGTRHSNSSTFPNSDTLSETIKYTHIHKHGAFLYKHDTPVHYHDQHHNLPVAEILSLSH